MGFLTYLMGLSGLAGAMILYCLEMKCLNGHRRGSHYFSPTPCLLEHLFVVRTPISLLATFSLCIDTVWLIWFI